MVASIGRKLNSPPPVSVSRALRQAAAGQLKGPRAKSSAGLPAEIPTPSMDYYRQRHLDFVLRNPGLTPPSYYLGYGQKYLERFAGLTSSDLSPDGLAWRDRTLKKLQHRIEQARMEDPSAFAQLERHDAAFKRFAYDTHAEAYLRSGLFDLPAQDLSKIVSVPDLKDLLSEEGLRQVLSLLIQRSPADCGRIALATLRELSRQALLGL